MLFLVHRNTAADSAITEVARELSLILKPWAEVTDLRALLDANTRRIVFLSDADFESDAAEHLAAAASESLGVIAVAGHEDRLSGIDNVVWLDDPTDIPALRAAARECWQRMLTFPKEALEGALQKREFVIQYQPKVERTSGLEWVTGEAESLIRWRHPEHGLLGPLEFLPEVEAFGLMGAVTEMVLNEAVLQLGEWRRQGMELKSCINLAPSLLAYEGLPARYAKIVTDAGERCESFTFEVPESDIRNSDAPHLRVLREFRKLGFRVSLDDFGVAASSLSAFEQLPFDEIKIHPAALRRATVNPAARQVLAAVTGLAHNLGITVCAEGVEDQDTFDFLKTIECDKMQGFLISEAVMPDIIRHRYNTVDEVA